MESKQRGIESFNGAIIGVDRRSRPKYVLMGFVCPVYMLKPQPKRTVSSTCSFLQCRTSRSSLPLPWEVPTTADFSQDEDVEEDAISSPNTDKRHRPRFVNKLHDTVAINEKFFNMLSSSFVLHDVSHCASANDQAALLFRTRTSSSSSSSS